MKKLNSVPDAVKNLIQSEHDKALSILFEHEIPFCSLPTRIVRMNTLRQSEGESMRTVIVPATTVHVNPQGFLDKVTLDRNALKFSVGGTNIAFPLAHVFKATGHICLGSIFVPSKISAYTPAQPLETLFLHNDRNFHHGGAILAVSPTRLQQIFRILEKNNIRLSNDAREIELLDNILVHDAIWILSNDVLEQTSPMKAVRIMDEIYKCIFFMKDRRKKGK